MPDGLLLILAMIATLGGMAGFALSNEDHWRQLFGARKTAASRDGCRAIGVAGVMGSLLLCALADPFSMAILVWPMLLGIGAAIVAAFLTIDARSKADR